MYLRILKKCTPKFYGTRETCYIKFTLLYKFLIVAFVFLYKYKYNAYIFETSILCGIQYERIHITHSIQIRRNVIL